MLYLKASSEIEILDEFNGEKGVFLKTFAISDRRNKNGWRATWDSIKKHISTFQDNARPGIEYERCQGTVCDLDHTDGTTKEQNIKVQEDFRVTTIVNHTLDEENHTAFFIHKLEPGQEEFFEKVQRKEIEFVSPSIWPEVGGFEIVGEMPSGLPMIDVWDWDGLHEAFLTKNPAFGDDAKITATCEGENCHMKLLTAKEYEAADEELQEKIKNVAIVYPDWTEQQVREKAIELIKKERTKKGIDLSPLQQIPILVRHKDKLRFVSVTKCVAKKLQANLENDIAINEETLMRAIQESKTNSDQNTSFSACTCSANHMTLDATEEKELRDNSKANEEKIKELESKLKATEDEKKELQGKLKAAEKDEDEKVTAAKKAQEESEQEKKKLEAKIKEPLIATILDTARSRLSESDVTKLEASLNAKSIEQVEEAIMMSNLSASKVETPGVHFEFADSQTGAPLTAKSLEETFGEAKQ